ncbi:MAG: acyl-CoA thioesterase/BAAT N-terminal domain-containing protein, partial [Candidatus Eremiobacteraeota bacterium]|nr:acyl-CoA thioesterase/BAAT N-terminal domain-containing protein [Candidatus Eremiobacteraeota bacterium]
MSPLIFAAAGLALTAIPKAALFDAPVHIVARAAPFSVVTIEAATKIDGNRYHSWASFRTNHEGVVDVARSAPTAGSYTSSDAMGLFWSMTPFGPSVFSTPTLEPMLVSLTVNAGTRHAKVTLTRLRTAPDVIRQPIQNAPFVGTLFQHQSGPPRAIVVVLGGSEG